MKAFVLALSLSALCSLSFAGTSGAANGNKASASAQQGGAPLSRSPFSTSTCSFTFTSGAKNTFLKYCVTANGNITELETPLNQEHIALGDFGEGYGMCDDNSNVAYFDYADFGDTPNWRPSTIVSQTASSLKIARTTADGVWTLTQTISQVTGTSSVKIAMTLKNNSTVDRSIDLMRYADVDSSGNSDFITNQDATINTAFAWNSVGVDTNPFGLVMQNVGTSLFDYQGIVQAHPGGPSPCSAFADSVPGPLTATDGSIVMIYFLSVPKGASKTVTVSYRGL